MASVRWPVSYSTEFVSRQVDIVHASSKYWPLFYSAVLWIWEKPKSPALPIFTTVNILKSSLWFWCCPPPNTPTIIYLRPFLILSKGIGLFFKLNNYILQRRPTLTTSEEFLKNLDSKIKNLKIVEIETCTRLKFSKLSRSRFARDSWFVNCRDRDSVETTISRLSRPRFLETSQKLSRSRFLRDSRWSLSSSSLGFGLLTSLFLQNKLSKVNCCFMLNMLMPWVRARNKVRVRVIL